MTTQTDSKQFLANDVNGRPMYLGDRVFSLFHHQWVVLTGTWTDMVDDELFITCDAGTARPRSLCKISQATLNAIRNQG